MAIGETYVPYPPLEVQGGWGGLLAIPQAPWNNNRKEVICYKENQLTRKKKKKVEQSTELHIAIK